jgi:hypothetical protein
MLLSLQNFAWWLLKTTNEIGIIINSYSARTFSPTHFGTYNKNQERDKGLPSGHLYHFDNHDKWREFFDGSSKCFYLLFKKKIFFRRLLLG